MLAHYYPKEHVHVPDYVLALLAVGCLGFLALMGWVVVQIVKDGKKGG